MIFESIAAGWTLAITPTTLWFLMLGVLLGLVVGLLPGLGGPVGIAVMLPFIFSMSPVDAFAFLIGLLSVTSTAADMTAIAFGIPGEPTSAALTLDGHQFAKSGRLGYALASSVSASLFGGLIGAAALLIAIPFLRPFVLQFAAPELFVLTLLGMTFVATLSGTEILKGIASASLGLMISFVGLNIQTATPRYTFDQAGLWDGVGLVAVAVGLFAIPELIDLVARDTESEDATGASDPQEEGSRPNPDVGAGAAASSVAESAHRDTIELEHGTGFRTVWRGVSDTARDYRLVTSSSMIGVGFGILPGIGGAVAQWIAYGHGLRRGQARNPGRRGPFIEAVISPGAANNSKEGGSLVPTLALGIPGSVTMAVLLGAFLIKGIAPGPEMVSKNLNLTMALVWFLVFANILGAILCLILIPALARMTQIRPALIIPPVTVLILLGAYAEKSSMWDFWFVLATGFLGLVMTWLKWPKPPLLLGLVLGSLSERYLYISSNRYGLEWLTRPIVIGVLTLMVVAPILTAFRRRERTRAATEVSKSVGRRA